jgi:ornithine carbamoyltransferase
MRHLRTVLDLVDDNTLQALLVRANQLRHAPRQSSSPVAGKTVAMLFERPSTRTRVSFEAGINGLGGHAIILHGRDTQLGAEAEGGEPLRDVARVLGGYVQALVVRPSSAHAVVEEVARHAGVPVINGQSDFDHPCQVLTDVFTVAQRREKPFVQPWAFVGDAVSMAHGYMAAATLAGFPLRLAMPEPQRLDAGLLARCKARGARIDVVDDPRRAVEDADVVATAQATRPRQPSVQLRFQVNDALLSQARPGAIVLHPLPARRGHEITDEVLEGNQSAAFAQAHNRVAVQQAILELLLSPAVE